MRHTHNVSPNSTPNLNTPHTSEIVSQLDDNNSNKHKSYSEVDGVFEEQNNDLSLHTTTNTHNDTRQTWESGERYPNKNLPDRLALNQQNIQLKRSLDELTKVTETMKSFFILRISNLEKHIEENEQTIAKNERRICLLTDKCAFYREQNEFIFKNISGELQAQIDQNKVLKWQLKQKELSNNKNGLSKQPDDSEIDQLKQLVEIREKQQERLAEQLNETNNTYMKLVEYSKEQIEFREENQKYMENLRKEIADGQSQIKKLRTSLTIMERNLSSIHTHKTTNKFLAISPQSMDIQQICEFLFKLEAEISVIFQQYLQQVLIHKET